MKLESFLAVGESPKGRETGQWRAPSWLARHAGSSPASSTAVDIVEAELSTAAKREWNGSLGSIEHARKTMGSRQRKVDD